MSIAYGDDKQVKGSEILDLYADAGWLLHGSRDGSEVERAVRGADVFITARDGAKLVGFASALTDRSYYAYVTEFLVRQSHRGRGIGTALVSRTLEALAAERVITIFAEPDAQAFYRKFGFASTAGGMLLRRQ